MQQCRYCKKSLSARSIQKQGKYCSRDCWDKHVAKLATEDQHFCTGCGRKIKKQICRHWICRDCKRTNERNYYYHINKRKSNLLSRRYYENHKEEIKALAKYRGHRRNQTLRLAAIKKYGGKCICCGERQIEFLAIDHTNGGGSKHRKAIKKSIYLYLHQENYPEGFRILCHNCNSARGYYGYCPHKTTLRHKEEEKNKTKVSERGATN